MKVLLRIALILGLTVAFACGSCGSGPVTARVRGSLDVLGQVVDPAYELAMEGCKRSDTVVTDQLIAGTVTKAEGLAFRAAIVQRCNGLASAFEVIRAAQARALGMYDAGKLAEAEAQIDQALRTLKEVM